MLDEGGRRHGARTVGDRRAAAGAARPWRRRSLERQLGRPLRRSCVIGLGFLVELRLLAELRFLLVLGIGLLVRPGVVGLDRRNLVGERFVRVERLVRLVRRILIGHRFVRLVRFGRRLDGLRRLVRLDGRAVGVAVWE